MDFNKISNYILYPNIAFIIMFLPISIALLVFSLIYLDTESIVSILSYLLAFYMLVVICLKIPNMITFFKTLKNENKYLQKLFSDVHYRINISLYVSLLWNGAFAIFQLGLGFAHGSVWFYSMAAYYVMLAIMRFFLLRHTRVYRPNQRTLNEVEKYALCGWLLLIMNLALSVIIFFIVYWNRTFIHHEITTITMAAYTFTTFTVAIVNSIRFKKYNSPVYSAAKTITLIAATVSMLTLETTMLTTFGGSEADSFRQILLGITGGVVSIFCITMAIIMIVKSFKLYRNAKYDKIG